MDSHNEILAHLPSRFHQVSRPPASVSRPRRERLTSKQICDLDPVADKQAFDRIMNQRTAAYDAALENLKFSQHPRAAGTLLKAAQNVQDMRMRINPYDNWILYRLSSQLEKPLRLASRRYRHLDDICAEEEGRARRPHDAATLHPWQDPVVVERVWRCLLSAASYALVGCRQSMLAALRPPLLASSPEIAIGTLNALAGIKERLPAATPYDAALSTNELIALAGYVAAQRDNRAVTAACVRLTGILRQDDGDRRTNGMADSAYMNYLMARRYDIEAPAAPSKLANKAAEELEHPLKPRYQRRTSKARPGRDCIR